MQEAGIRSPWSVLILLGSAGWMLTSGGCVAPAALVTPMGMSAFEATAGAYIKGRLEVAERERMENVIAATQGALTDLVLPITDAKLRDDEATIFSRTIDNTTIKIVIERMSPLMCKISIRVGMLGDHAISQLVMSNIQRRITEGRENPDSLPKTPIVPVAPREKPQHPPYG